MNFEENRLNTFSTWPANAAVDAAQIAKAGFYYSGHSLVVQCFLCGITISDWNCGDQATSRHREAAPDCPFVQNPFGTCNVPLTPCITNNLRLASTLTDVLQDTNNCDQQLKTWILYYKESPEKLKILSERLKTFTNWPISSIVLPKKLAMSGFYYLQVDDMVQCAYCKGILFKWEPGDDPNIEHKLHFPSCYFIMHQDEDDTFYLNNVNLIPGTSSSLTELGIQKHTGPKKPNYATYEERIRTFCGWPENNEQTPEQLAIAGFYYTGFKDHVRCFHCDGGLEYWKATDDAWIEHAIWFSNCEFVNLIRGKKFIKHCIDNRSPLDPSIFEGVPEVECPVTTETQPVLPSTQNLLKRIVEELLKSPVVEQTLEIGLNIESVKRTLEIRIMNFGTLYTNSNELIEDVFAMEDNDTRSELITSLDHVTQKATNNAIKQLNNNDAHITQQKINENKNERISSKEEKLELFNNEDDTYEKKMDVKLKEIAFLEEENRELKQARLCKICMDREVAIVFLPCGHITTCVHCAPSLTYCPMCRRKIRATVRTFLS